MLKERQENREEKEGKKSKRFSSFSIIVIFSTLMLLGFFFVPLLPLKLNPSKDLPVIRVSFSMWGQSARAVEMEATSKLESMLVRAEGVQSIESSSYNGGGNVTIRLSKHANPDMARFEVSTIVRQTWPSLPAGVSYPSISMDGTSGKSDMPFLRYTIISSQSPQEIQKYVENTIKPKLAIIQGVKKIDISGTKRMVYQLKYDYKQLQKLDISTNDIRSAIQSYLTKEFLGLAKLESATNNDQWIRVALVATESKEKFDPSKIQVKNNLGKIMYLDQLVQMTYEKEVSTSMFRINGQNTLNFAITANEAENQLLLSKQVQKEILMQMESLEHDGYTLQLNYDAGEYISEQLDKIYFRSGLTVLILLCFVFVIYRNIKYSFLIIFSLVTNMSIAAIFYYLFKIEMQIYSLAGLTISLTLIIDNTIIMSDQIIRQGNKKAFLAILTATLTTIGALTIIFFLDERIRLNLLDFAYVIIINLAISLAIALFLVPAVLEKLNIRKRNPRIREAGEQSLFMRIRNRLSNRRNLVYFNRIYKSIIFFMYRRKAWFIVFIILLFGLPVFMLPTKLPSDQRNRYVYSNKELSSWENFYNTTLGSTFYLENIKPISDVALGGTLRLFVNEVKQGSYGTGEKAETVLNVTASLPNGSTLKQMNALVEEVETFITQFPEIRQFETYVNNGQQANIRIFLTKEHQRSAAPHKIQAELIRKVTTLGGGSWGVYGVGDGFNNSLREGTGSSKIKLLGFNYDELTVQAESVRDSLLQLRRIKEVTIDSEFSWYKKDYMEFVFDLDKERLAYEDIHPNRIFNSISPIFVKNQQVANWVSEGEITPINITSNVADEIDVWDLLHQQGYLADKAYKIDNIAKIAKYQAPKNIAKENQQYRLCIQYEYIGSYQQANNVMEKTIDSFNKAAPLGYKAETETNQYWWKQGGNNQYWLLLLIIAIVFVTTSILFNSVKQPFVVIFIIPISFIGIFLTFYFFNLNFDQGGFAAFILLSGLSINANIYVLNEYNNIRILNPNMHPLTAYLKAWNAKIKPIFLTVVSTVLGFIPFMIGEYKEAFWFPLAAGTAGGLVLSLLALFLYLPLCMGVGRRKAMLK